MHITYSKVTAQQCGLRKQNKEECTMCYGYGGGYGGGYGCGGGCGGGFGSGFALLVVLFILLIIVGAAFCC